MAKVNIGKTEYLIPEMSFRAVELSWPYVEQAMATIHPVDGVNAAMAVIAGALVGAEGFDYKLYGITEPFTIDENTQVQVPWPDEVMLVAVSVYLKKRLLANEMGAVKVCLFDMLKEAGFEMADTGEPQGQASSDEVSPEVLAMLAETPSTATAHDTSPSSLPPELSPAAGTSSEGSGELSATS